MATKIQLRRDTAANWTAANPVLASGEPALETDTRKEKIGDGVTAWNALPYKAAGQSAQVIALSGTNWALEGQNIYTATIAADTVVTATAATGTACLLEIVGAGHLLTLNDVVITTNLNGTTLVGVVNAGGQTTIILPSATAQSGGIFLQNRVGLWTKATMVKTGGEVTSWPDTNANPALTFGQSAGLAYPVDAGAAGLQIADGTQNLELPAYLNVAPPCTFYLKVKRAAASGFLTNREGTGYGVYATATETFLKKDGGQYNVLGTAILPDDQDAVLTIVLKEGQPASAYVDGVYKGTTGNALLEGWGIGKLCDQMDNMGGGTMAGLVVYSVAHTPAQVLAIADKLKTVA